MMTDGTNLLVFTVSAIWSWSRWPFELQKAEKYPIRWSLMTGFTVQWSRIWAIVSAIPRCTAFGLRLAARNIWSKPFEVVISFSFNVLNTWPIRSHIKNVFSYQLDTFSFWVQTFHIRVSNFRYSINLRLLRIGGKFIPKNLGQFHRWCLGRHKMDIQHVNALS